MLPPREDAPGHQELFNNKTPWRSLVPSNLRAFVAILMAEKFFS
jgi:hypothetical protein